MSELRKDYITNGWVVIATERDERPGAYRRYKDEDDFSTCPLCEGREASTPPEVLAYRCTMQSNAPGWRVRCIPNKYPALRSEGDVDHRIEQLFNRMNGVGVHEVIIECPHHETVFSKLAENQIAEVLRAYQDRYVELMKDKRIRYILIFKNQGRGAGATLMHSHSQLIATPMIPRRILDELEGARNYYQATGGRCIYDDIIDEELKRYERVVFDSTNYFVLSPYAARFPYEVWLLPKRHEPFFENLNNTERKELAEMLKKILTRFYVHLGNPPYNYFIHTSPCDGQDYRFYHWHIEIMPRLTNPAGFERGTGFYINPVSPEEASVKLKKNL
jgi:UDPglucose--hexose-1-phosphate uridylyltransferase